MERLNELYSYKAKYEAELEEARKKVIYGEAYVKVVNDMIADEKAKLSKETESNFDSESTEQTVLED